MKYRLTVPNIERAQYLTDLARHRQQLARLTVPQLG